MRISAKVDYGIRALVELAHLQTRQEGPVRREQIRAAQDVPVAFLENILLELKRAGVVASVRGQRGGFRLAKPAAEITVADVIRAVDGPLTSVRGVRPEDLDYSGSAQVLQDVWVAVRASLRGVLETVTIADLETGRLPRHVARLARPEEAWRPH